MAANDKNSFFDSFRLFGTYASVGMFLCNREGEYIAVNNALELLAGQPAAELCGSRWIEKIHPQDRERVRSAWSDAIRRESAFTCEHRFIGAMAEASWVLAQAVPVRGADGSIEFFFGTVVDISARREVEASLAKSEQFFEAIVENIPNMIFVKDAEELRFVRINRAGEALLGLRRDELIGKNDFDFFPREQAEFFTRKDREVLGREGAMLTTEEPINTKGAGTRILRTKKFEVRDPQGELSYLVGISEDITAEKHAERDLLKAKNVAEEATRVKAAFLANMSHEIRTPMTGILGMVDLLFDTPLAAEQRDYLETIHSSASVLLTVINDILDFSKIEAERLQLTPRPCYLRAVIEAVVKLFSPQAQERDIDLTMEVSPMLPQSVLADPDRITQVLMNLVGNAIKFTEKGAVTITCHPVFAGDGLAAAEFTVADTGSGIAPELLSRIFEPFFQADDTSTRAVGGTGLGLAISSRLVQMMGGALEVASVTGEGSAFRFSLPVQILQEPPQPEPRTPHRCNCRDGSCIILLVEDNEINRLIVERVLTKEGHTVVHATNGQEAVELARERHFDLILMDLQMPVLDGWSAFRQIRAGGRFKSQSTPVVALTAHSMSGDEERCLQAGMDGYLSKPIDRAALITAVNRFAARPSSVLRSSRNGVCHVDGEQPVKNRPHGQ